MEEGQRGPSWSRKTSNKKKKQKQLKKQSKGGVDVVEDSGDLERVEREIESLEQEVKHLRERLCHEGVQANGLKSKRHEHAVYRHIQAVAQSEMQRHFDRLDALATVMADVYNDKHRLLEVEKQQRVVAQGQVLEGVCHRELRQLLHATDPDGSVIDTLYQRHSYRDMVDALTANTEEAAQEVEANAVPLNTSTFTDRSTDDRAPPNLILELEQLVHEEERRYVHRSLEADGHTHRARHLEDQAQQHMNALELQLGDTRADATLREHLAVMAEAAAVEAEAAELNACLQDAQSVLEERTNRQRDLTAKQHDLSSFEDEMRMLGGELMRLSQEVEGLRHSTDQQLDKLRRADMSEEEERIHAVQSFTHAGPVQEEISLASSFPLSALPIADIDSLPLRVGSLAVHAEDQAVGGYWRPSFARRLRSTLLEPHESADNVLSTLLQAQYRAARVRNLCRAAEQTATEVQRQRGGSHRPETIQGILANVGRADETQRTTALPEVNGAMDWLQEARDDVNLAQHLLQDHINQPAFGLA